MYSKQMSTTVLNSQSKALEVYKQLQCILLHWLRPYSKEISVYDIPKELKNIIILFAMQYYEFDSLRYHDDLIVSQNFTIVQNKDTSNAPGYTPVCFADPLLLYHVSKIKFNRQNQSQ